MNKVLRSALIIVVMSAVIFGLYLFLVKDKGKGALQVTSTPKAAVYIDGKLIGQTPLCKCEANDMLVSGDYTIRLVPFSETELNSFSPFEQKITIHKSVLTVVDRTFDKGASSEGSIITLNKASNPKAVELLMLSFPDKADVLLDSNSIGQTPVFLKNTTNSDHELIFKKEGYKDKSVRIKTVTGYKLEALVFLGITKEETIPPTATPSSTQPTTTPAKIQQVVITQTPTGYLNVRASNSVNAAKINTVYPGDIYDLLDEKDGWYQIKFSDGTKGWVISDYAIKK